MTDVPPGAPRLLTVTDAARVAGMRPNAVRYWVDSGQLPAANARFGHLRWIRTSDLVRHLERLRVEPDWGALAERL